MSEEAEKKLIWHYTRIEVLKEIINTKIMLATHFNKLNDSGEILYGVKKFEELYKDCLDDKKISTLNSYSRVVEDSERVFFIISFSRSIDSLYQWIAYTDPQKGGCAIGFESDNLFKYPKGNPPQHNDCLYTDEQILKRFLPDKLNNNPTFYCLLHPMSFIKHPCFEEEKEHRYLFNDLNKRKVKKFQVKPYIKCRIRDLSSIKKIII
mgnify:CR=1 FL=1